MLELRCQSYGTSRFLKDRNGCRKRVKRRKHPKRRLNRDKFLNEQRPYSHQDWYSHQHWLRDKKRRAHNISIKKFLQAIDAAIAEFHARVQAKAKAQVCVRVVCACLHVCVRACVVCMCACLHVCVRACVVCVCVCVYN